MPFNEHFSTIGPRLARKIPLTSDEESIYLKNITENYNKICFRPPTTSDVFTHLENSRLGATRAEVNNTWGVLARAIECA